MMRTFLVGLLLASVASAQTYVRPSKGKAFNPFPIQPGYIEGCGNFFYPWGPTDGGEAAFPMWPYYGLTAGAIRVDACSQVYDWTAFDGMQINYYSDRASQNLSEPSGVACAELNYRKDITNVGSYIRFRIYQDSLAYAGSVGQEYSSLVYIEVQEAASPAGPFYPVTRDEDMPGFSGHPAWGNCPLFLSVTPIPFQAPTSVAVKPVVSNSSFSSALPVKMTYDCSATDDPFGATGTFKRITMTGVTTTVVDGGSAADRFTQYTGYAKVCNNISFNMYSPVVCYRYTGYSVTDPFSPWVADGGVTLQNSFEIEPGNCVTYPLNGQPLQCVGNPGVVLTKHTCVYGATKYWN